MLSRSIQVAALFAAIGYPQPARAQSRAPRPTGPAVWLGASLGRTLTFPGRDLGILSVDVNVVRARHWFGDPSCPPRPTASSGSRLRREP